MRVVERGFISIGESLGYYISRIRSYILLYKLKSFPI